jgi:ATP-binding cassette subfamily B protein
VVLGTAAIGFMLYIHVQLTLYVLIPMPLIVLSTRLLGRRMHRHYRKVQAAFADMTEVVRERFAGIRMIKAHHAGAAAAGAVRSASTAYITENIRLVGVTGVFFPMMMLLTNLSLALVLYFGGRRAILAEISPGDFVAFVSYLNLLAWPMMALGMVTNLIQRGGASLDRLKTILERRPGIANRTRPRDMAHSQGHIRFEAVSFAYGDTRVLNHVDFELARGEMLGIIGPPGSGKSTLLNLVPRLYDVSAGRITIDGRDIRDLDLSDLRRNIAFVSQEPFLFAGTVLENLLFGCPEGCRDRLDAAISDAGLEETIRRFPEGLHTVVGEKGILLSGGQKQRIALARALLVDAPMLLLDDPISQVDTVTGRRISETIAALAGSRTVLIVSHRMSSVRTARQIITLQRGEIVESGDHRGLMAAGGYYCRVTAMQELEYAV